MKTKYCRKFLFFVVAWAGLLVVPAASQSIAPPWPWPINSDYGPRLYDADNDGARDDWDFHEGVDYLGPLGASIFPVEDGTIAAIGFSGGWYVSVDGGHGHWAYIHIFSDGSLPRNSGNW